VRREEQLVLLPRTIERFVCDPQLEPKVIARRPRLNEILRIGWEKEVID
jgi:hypothetical protein